MPWQRRLLAAFLMVGGAVCLTTAAASAQSLNAPDAHHLASSATSSATKAVQPAVQAAQPAVQAAKASVPAVAKAAQPVAQAAQPVTQAAHQTATSAAKTLANAATAVQPPQPAIQPPALPTPTVQIPHADARSVVDQTVETVTESVSSSVEAVAETATSSVEAVAETVVPRVAAEAKPTVDDMARVLGVVESAAPAEADEVAPPPTQPIVTLAKLDQLTPSHEDPPGADEPMPVAGQPDAAADAPLVEPVVTSDSPPVIVSDAAPTTSASAGSTGASALYMPPIAEWDVIAPEEPVVNEPLPALSPSQSDVTVFTQPADPLAPLSAPIDSAPSGPPNGLPVTTGGGGSTSSMIAGWLPMWMPVSVTDNWRSLHLVGRRLPSVIALPNLAPPG